LTVIEIAFENNLIHFAGEAVTEKSARRAIGNLARMPELSRSLSLELTECQGTPRFPP
jgi:hypothetical protein